MASKYEHDYLTEDSKVPGQDYVCVSFLEPGEEQRAGMIDEIYSSVGSKLSSADIRGSIKTILDEYDARYKPKRGLKIRGSYRDYERAKKRSEQLIEEEPEVNVFVSQVGYWCQYNPDSNKVGDSGAEEHYSCNDKANEAFLNDMVGDYKKQRTHSKQVFENRKRDMVEKAVYEGSKEGQAEMKNRKEPLEAVEFSLETAQLNIKELQEKLEHATRMEALYTEKIKEMKASGEELPKIGDDTSLPIPDSFDADNAIKHIQEDLEKIVELRSITKDMEAKKG